MHNRFFVSLFILCAFSFNVVAKNNDNPFAKSNTLDVSKDVPWSVDTASMLATKSAKDASGTYYHLMFDNKQIELQISSDTDGKKPKKFTSLEVKNLKVDGKSNALFAWCLKNQQSHSRFLQQGLSVKKDVCVVDGNAGRFIMKLDRDTLTAMQNGKSLSIVLKPYRTPLEINYDLTDFQDMYVALNAKSKAASEPAGNAAAAPGQTKCWAKPPVKYKSIRSIEYPCADASAKINAETLLSRQVNEKKDNERRLAAQRAAEDEKQRQQRKVAEEKKQKEMAAQLEQEKRMQAEAAAIAASEEKQAKLDTEISQKMIGVCDKFWSKGEHRCYCQKYIEHAPAEIQQNSTCE